MGKFKFPTAYTILFVLIALVAAMTWIAVSYTHLTLPTNREV